MYKKKIQCVWRSPAFILHFESKSPIFDSGSCRDTTPLVDAPTVNRRFWQYLNWNCRIANHAIRNLDFWSSRLFSWLAEPVCVGKLVRRRNKTIQSLIMAISRWGSNCFKAIWNIWFETFTPFLRRQVEHSSSEYRKFSNSPANLMYSYGNRKSKIVMDRWRVVEWNWQYSFCLNRGSRLSTLIFILN